MLGQAASVAEAQELVSAYREDSALETAFDRPKRGGMNCLARLKCTPPNWPPTS